MLDRTHKGKVYLDEGKQCLIKCDDGSVIVHHTNQNTGPNKPTVVRGGVNVTKHHSKRLSCSRGRNFVYGDSVPGYLASDRWEQTSF